jgi:hypothetical protein
MIKHQWNMQIIGNKQYNIYYEAYIGKRQRKCNITCTLFSNFFCQTQTIAKVI